MPVGSALLSWIPHRVPVPPRASFSSGADVRRGCGSFLLVRLLGPGSSAAVGRDSSFGLSPFSLVFSSALLFLSRVCLDSPSRVATLPVFTDEGALSSGLSFPLHSLWVEKMVRTSLEFLVQSSSLHGFFCVLESSLLLVTQSLPRLGGPSASADETRVCSLLGC